MDNLITYKSALVSSVIGKKFVHYHLISTGILEKIRKKYPGTHALDIYQEICISMWKTLEQNIFASPEVIEENATKHLKSEFGKRKTA
jgi:hypothetical protein